MRGPNVGTERSPGQMVDVEGPLVAASVAPDVERPHAVLALMSSVIGSIRSSKRVTAINNSGA
jgi:hypothetical protein